MSTHFDTDSFMRLNTMTETHANKAAERTQQAVSALDSDPQKPVAYSSDRSAFVRPKGTTLIKYKRAVGEFRLEGKL